MPLYNHIKRRRSEVKKKRRKKQTGHTPSIHGNARGQRIWDHNNNNNNKAPPITSFKRKMLNDQTLIIFFIARFASLFSLWSSFHFFFLSVCPCFSHYFRYGKCSILPLNEPLRFFHSFRLAVAIVRAAYTYIFFPFFSSRWYNANNNNLFMCRNAS